MTHTEALRLALRAMMVNNQAWKHLADSGDAGFWDAEEQGFYQLNEQAIAACEAALEAKDEPVGWRDAAIRLGEELSSVGPNGYYDMDAKKWLDWAMEQNPRGKHSLPQRKPLTDEEMKKIWYDMNSIMGWYSFQEIARAIEAAHGIK